MRDERHELFILPRSVAGTNSDFTNFFTSPLKPSGGRRSSVSFFPFLDEQTTNDYVKLPDTEHERGGLRTHQPEERLNVFPRE